MGLGISLGILVCCVAPVARARVLLTLPRVSDPNSGGAPGWLSPTPVECF